jgi:hypothetical protein
VNHAELERELPWYVNATASPELRERIERAAPGCEHCADELGELRALRDVLVASEAAAAAPSSALQEGVMRRIEAPAAPRKAWFDLSFLRRNPLAGFAALATVAILALFLVPSFVHTWGGTSTIESPVDSSEGLTGAVGAPAPALPPVMPAPKTVGGVAAFAARSPAQHQRAGTGHAGADAADAAARAGRQLARNGAIGLIVPDVTTALGQIQRLTDAQFGAVTGLEDTAPSAPGESHTARVTVSVPDDRFTHTLGALSALGGVTSRSVKTEDLTDSIVDGDARLRNLRHEETDLLRIMDRSGKISDVLDVEQQLASTREAIEQLDAQQKAMRQRVAYATIVIDLSDEKTTPVAVAGPGTQIAQSWHGAVRALWAFTLIVIAQGLLLVAFAPYLVVLGLVAYFGYRRIARRR